MNTKFFFVLLAVVLIATACAPAIVESAAPVEPAALPADTGKSVSIPVTGVSASSVAGQAQESRQWSGEIFLSDNNGPDLKPDNNVHIEAPTSPECTSEDSQPRRQSGCIE